MYNDSEVQEQVEKIKQFAVTGRKMFGVAAFFERKCTDYYNAIDRIEESLFKYFNQNIVDTLAGEPLPFDIHHVFSLIRSKLNENAKSFFIKNVDRCIINESYSFQISKEGFDFIPPLKDYSPKVQEFMQQFAYAVTLYQVCLGVAVIYEELAERLQITQYKEMINGMNEIVRKVNTVKNGEGSYAQKHALLGILFKQATDIDTKISNLIAAQKSDADFYNEKSSQLINLLNLGVDCLKGAYQQFPNKSLLSWLVRDTNWHRLLKTISFYLYSNQYSFNSVIDGTHKEIQQHIATFSVLKIEFLGKVNSLVHEEIFKIRVQGSLLNHPLPIYKESSEILRALYIAPSHGKPVEEMKTKSPSIDSSENSKQTPQHPRISEGISIKELQQYPSYTWYRILNNSQSTSMPSESSLVPKR